MFALADVIDDTLPRLITLAEAATLIPHATAATLKRKIRQKKLIAYRVGKQYITTAENVWKMVFESCRVAPKVRTGFSAPPGTMPQDNSPTDRHGLSSTELANAALDSVLTQVKKLKTRR